MVSRSSLPRFFGVLACFSLLGGCVTDATSVKPGEPRSIVVPSNHRQVVARYIATKMNPGRVLRAEISRPGVWERPEFAGGPRPIVCARWTAEGPIIQQTHTIAFMFENGKISEVFDPQYINPAAGGAFGAWVKNAATCGKLSYVRYPELIKARAK